MLSALISFLGGSAFRMIWGEVAAYFSKRQDHQHELEHMRLQQELDAKRHEQDMARIKLQSELNIKEVEVAGDVAINKVEAEAFVEAIKEANKSTGVKWVDGWNGCVRPAAATVALLLWIAALIQAGFITTEWDKELIATIFGFFFASRELMKRNK